MEFSDWNLKDFSIPPSFEKESYHRQQNERKKMRQSEELVDSWYEPNHEDAPHK